MDRDPHGDSQKPDSDDLQEGAMPGMPRCPKCGWQDVRLSHSKGVVDSMLLMFSFHAFRCRSCGSRFHRFYRRRPEEI
jgi:hypothetical protein